MKTAGVLANALRAAADELDEQREALERIEGLFAQCRDLLVQIKGSGERTHGLLVSEANRLGGAVTSLRNRIVAVERRIGVTPAE